MNYRIGPPNTESMILMRLLASGPLSLAAAEYLLSLRFDENDIARMSELSELVRQGKLTGERQVELDSYIHVSNLLAIIQSKGRRALQRSTQ